VQLLCFALKHICYVCLRVHAAASCVLQKYENNLKKGLLTDNTIMLWNERCAAAAAAAGQDSSTATAPVLVTDAACASMHSLWCSR
jgi:hypothetical protein